MIQTNIKSFDTAELMTYRLGELEILIVSDGVVNYEDRCFAPGIPGAVLTTLMENHGAVQPYFRLAHNVMLIRFKDRIILIDAGNGYKEQPHAGRLTDYLLFAGILPETVTDIVLTHAHPDHIDGLIDENCQLIFSKAVIHISEQEFTFWQGNADFSKSKDNMKSLLALQQSIRFFFSIVKDQLKCFNTEEPLFDCLQPVHAPGHTPGHCMFILKSGNEKLIHLGDIFHDEMLLFTEPEWGTIFDVDFELAGLTRRNILKKFAGSGQLLFGYHLSWPGFGYIEPEKVSFKWVGV